MKTLASSAAMSPESTVSCYRIINCEVNVRLGGNHSADLHVHSIDFETIAVLQRKGERERAGKLLAQSAGKLESIGTEAMVPTTNTMHKVADATEAAVKMPLLHMVDATAAVIEAQGLQRVGLLGTRFTMGDGFYGKRMHAQGTATVVAVCG